MDLDRALTFMTVSSTGSFARAAERLHLTQAAVSARVHALETELGRKLFVRNKAGARLTTAGHEFLPYAAQLVQVWERARQQVALRPGRESVLTLGGELSLWSALLLNWVVLLRRSRPAVALRTEVDNASRLLDRVQNGSLDIAILYTPQQRPGVESSLVIEEDLIAVSTSPKARKLGNDGYVFVDWGPDFAAQHDAHFPDLRDAGLCVGLGPLALRYILLEGGSGYFRSRAVQGHINRGKLHRVRGAPTISHSVYAAYSERSDHALIEWAREGLARAAQHATEPWI
jgi:DNA-binding transcriptional LysR family regulator